MRLVIGRPNHIELLRDGASERVASFELLPAQDLVDEFVSPRLRYSDPIFGFGEQEVGFDLEGRWSSWIPAATGSPTPGRESTATGETYGWALRKLSTACSSP